MKLRRIYNLWKFIAVTEGLVVTAGSMQQWSFLVNGVGGLRTKPITLTGTNKVLEPLSSQDFDEFLLEWGDEPDIRQRAVNHFTGMVYAHPFEANNRVLAYALANKVLLEAGQPMMCISNTNALRREIMRFRRDESNDLKQLLLDAIKED
ncbi:hypothetical protein [Enterocloster hominis (ex Hitch et al. 2024)]|uniref:Fido domain-containing protein n=1 Tax=Enterocloster hominis (ex Hitch et al. 2024) TaxID=1917870 RepID=A0ABV1DGK0_9FIRM